MKGTEVRTVVRIPLSDIAHDVAQLHGIKLQLTTVKIDGDSLVLEYADAGERGGPSPGPTAESPEPGATPGSTTNVTEARTSAAQALSLPIRRKRRSGRRNRMKTRGWNVVTKTTNSHGQTVTIYEPFVSALSGMTGARRQKEKVVAEILRANGNRPGPDSIRYYLENTLEYLGRRTSQ